MNSTHKVAGSNPAGDATERLLLLWLNDKSRRGRPPRPRDALGRLRCKRCKRWKFEADYYAKDSRPYVHSYCKPCQIAKAKESYQRRRPQLLAPRKIEFPIGAVPVSAPGWGAYR